MASVAIFGETTRVNVRTADTPQRDRTLRRGQVEATLSSGRSRIELSLHPHVARALVAALSDALTEDPSNDSKL